MGVSNHQMKDYLEEVPCRTSSVHNGGNVNGLTGQGYLIKCTIVDLLPFNEQILNELRHSTNVNRNFVSTTHGALCANTWSLPIKETT
jgi:hypothetical protein